jgi:hypothetical protein|uniref:Uncharacterized protein n=1 Tax=viral metagenome TaxID=1070528 RepID=A0A6C0CBM4_9ZZZZ
MAFKITFDNVKILVIACFTLLGLYYYVNSYKYYETMENAGSNKRCPNMLIEKDGAYYLYNSNLAVVPGVNPIQFKNLEDYSEFIEWQNSQKIHCPVLYLQYSTDTQNNELIQVKPSIFENQGGLPSIERDPLTKDSEKYIEENKILDATLDNSKEFNKNSYQGIDVQNQDIGLDNPIDKMFYSTESKSVNPMDPNWGGKQYTEKAVENCEFKDRYVYKHPPALM